MNYQDDYLLNFTDEISVKSLEEKVSNISLTKLDTINSGGITGVVVNSSLVPVDAATVKIFDLNYNPIKHTMTNSDGVYSITGMTSGEYIVYSIKDGFGLSTKRQITIDDTVSTLNDIMITKNTAIRKGTLYGVTYNMNKEPLSKILVTLSTNAEEPVVVSETYSTTDGEYVFYNIDAGDYIVNAISDDYILTESFDITIEEGVNNKEKLYLDKLSSAKEGTINGIITDEATSIPLENCFVGLYEIDDSGEETLTSVTVTNRDGKYFFGYVPEGNYIIKAKQSS